MEKKKLGDTDIEVSKLCFGSLTMTPFQANLSIQEGAYLINYAFDKGINFIDTAEIYENYSYIREALKSIKRENFVISTKTYAYTEELAQKSLELALKELKTDYIDIFMLHEQESVYTIEGHYDAINYLLKAKDNGKIRSIGISTHKVAGVIGAKGYKEIEIVHPLINKKGIGIHDGTINDMLKEVRELKSLGKGIYAMKALGGGHLIKDAEDSLKFVNNLSFIDSIAIGMQSIDEIDANIQLIEENQIEDKLKEKISKRNRRLSVADYCVGCGKCEKRCKQNGIKVIDNMAQVNENCILCGYCATVCPEFCIKVI